MTQKQEQEKGMTYTGTGVDYGAMDPYKLKMLEKALPTAKNLIQHGFREVTESRGESAYVVDVGPFLLAFVEEGLGTKNIVAEQMMQIGRYLFGLTGTTYHENIMHCNLAMQVNDLSTVGAAPFVSMLHTAAGNSKWFSNEKRNGDIATGQAEACDIAGCAWGGGESPTLRDIIFPGTAVYAGSCAGVINPKENLLLGSRVEHGNRIIVFRSSGVHANGYTLARDLEEKLPKGYMTELPSGQTYGEALLERTIIYAPLVNACASLVNYAINITGHGWRKLMRAQQPFRYVIKNLPVPQEIFTFIQKHGNVSDREAYGNLNMGGGYAFIVSDKNVAKIMQIAAQLGFDGIEAGYVESSDSRSVYLEPLNLNYMADELKVR